MPNLLVAGNSTNGGTAITTDTSGTLNIVTGSGSGSNAITIDASQAVVMPGNLTVSGTLTAGAVTNTTGSFSGNLSFNSGYGSAAIAYGCRAWVNFNSTGTVSIYGSGNCSSITDNGVGLFTFNFATAMPDTNYCVTTGPTQSSSNTNGGVMSVFLSATTTYSAPLVGSFRFITYHAANTALGDSTYNCLAVFR